MKSTFLSGLRSLFAVVAGFLVIGLGTTLTFTVWLGGIGFHTSSPTELALASVGALASGLAGGLVAALLAARRPLLHAAALLIPIALDTGSIIVFGRSADPAWFDLGGGATLALGALAAGYLFETKQRPRRTASQAP